MTTIRLAAKQYRTLPAPIGKTRVGLCYAQANKIPKEIFDWREVNPRDINTRSSVYKQILGTLTHDPEKFHERNRGITIVAKEVQYDDKKHEVVIKLEDKKLHGAVDGAHSLKAVLDTQDSPPETGWDAAYVFIKIMDGVEPAQIAEIAGGLNTSQQVDLKSLENLREHFDDLQKSIENESYADNVAYKMNQDKPIDVRDILYFMAVFDCEAYDDKTHPSSLFGRKEGIVRNFASQAKGEGKSNSFSVLITQAPEILKLRDTLEKMVLQQDVGKYKSGSKTRIRGTSNKDSELVFIGETVDGKIPLGWIMPMLGAFRANVEWNKPKGTFSWIVPIEDLLSSCIEDLVLSVKEIHERENSRPEYVGRNATSWRICYQAVSQEVLRWRLSNSSK